MTPDQIAAMPAGREMDDLVHATLFKTIPRIAKHLRHYSTDMEAAWLLVEQIQRMFPGWRFSIVGGDVRMGYKCNKDGSLKKNRGGDFVVDEQSRQPFGWHAEFFGDMDPRLNSGQRHAEGWGRTAPLAICRAALLSINPSEAKNA